MLVKILGIMDLLSAIGVLLTQYNVMSYRIPLIFGLFLMFKGWLFRDNWVSYLDFLIGVYLFAMMFGLSNIVLSFIFAVYLGQKALYSLFG